MICQPEGFEDAGASSATSEEGAEDATGSGGDEDVVMWTETVEEDGSKTYARADDPSVTRADRPEGTTLVAFESDTMFQKTYGEDGVTVTWVNTETGEALGEKPEGTTMIVEYAT